MYDAAVIVRERFGRVLVQIMYAMWCKVSFVRSLRLECHERDVKGCML